MKFTRLAGVLAVLVVLFLSNTVFAATQNVEDSLTRLNAQVSVQKVSLNDEAKAKVASSCQTTQSSLKNLRQKEQRIQRERTDTYVDVQNEIDALQLRLKRQGVEVSGAATVLMNYRELTDQYDRLSKIYSEALYDVTTVDCQANPEAFTAGVALVRQKRAELLTNTNTIQYFVQNDVQNQFNAIKRQLKV